MIKLTILGNNSALPAHGRHPTAQVIEMKDQLFLMDCGEGTQIQMQQFHVHRHRIHNIFISHLHGDHYFGLIGLISSMGLLGRNSPLHVFGPPELKEIIDLHLSIAGTILPFPLLFTAIEREEAKILIDTQQYSVRCFPVEHRIPCHGFVFTLKQGKRKILPEKCKDYGIPLAFFNALKDGEDYLRKDGVLVKNESVTEAGTPAKSYAYCADTRFTTSILPFIQNMDLLYHESTFLKDDAGKAALRFHSTTEQAAEIALKAHARKLLLGHFSSRYKELDLFLQEAGAIFPHVEISEEGKVYEI
jgi:ribonuclease Z